MRDEQDPRRFSRTSRAMGQESMKQRLPLTEEDMEDSLPLVEQDHASDPSNGKPVQAAAMQPVTIVGSLVKYSSIICHVVGLFELRARIATSTIMYHWASLSAAEWPSRLSI